MVEGLSPTALLQFGIAAGFVVAFLFATRVLQQVVTAWRQGDFVSKKVYENVLDENAKLRDELAKNTKAGRSVARALNRLAAALERAAVE